MDSASQRCATVFPGSGALRLRSSVSVGFVLRAIVVVSDLATSSGGTVKRVTCVISTKLEASRLLEKPRTSPKT